MTRDDDAGGGFASPPCYLHELDPSYTGLPTTGDVQQRIDVARWRKATRARLIAARRALDDDVRRTLDGRIAHGLAAATGDFSGRTVGAYWPFRGEPDLRPFFETVVARGGRCALPVVVARGRPLVFRAWTPGDPLARGAWGIPVPDPSAERLTPDIVVAPVVGFDRDCCRLGYGGGFYDRTLASEPARPRVFGVGYALAAVPTIYPQWHDVPMDTVITEAGRLDRTP